MPDPQAEFLDAIGALNKYERHNKLEFFKPYPYQHEFYGAYGYSTDRLADQRCLLAANQIGKTLGEAYEVALHATGHYEAYTGPDGETWPGHRISAGDGVIQVGSTTDTTVRDRCQADLCGDPEDPDSLGTGWIPKKSIVSTTRNQGVPNAYDAVVVRHVSGQTITIKFRSYEQGPKKHMGSRILYGWCDEEPPADIWSQYIRGTPATNGVLAITMTPEDGMTQIVYEFLNDIKEGQALIRATWDDAPHMTKEMQAKRLMQIPENERRMRSQGIPQVGHGLIFQVPDSQLIIDPIEIPPFWRRIVGVDFGSDHPFAAAWWAFDTQADIGYLYNDYRERKALISTHASAIKAHGDWIPIAWPHDGWQSGDKAAGTITKDIYTGQGLFMLRDHATHAPSPGMPEGSGGNALEPGVQAMQEAMSEGRIKVFSTCRNFLEEKQTYHRGTDGKIVRKYDDTISAARYGYMMRRFSSTKPAPMRKQRVAPGLRNW